MKPIKIFLVMAITLGVFAMNSEAQTRKLYLKSYDGSLMNYGTISTKTTTDSTLRALDSIVVNSGEGGLVEVQVVGFNDSLSKSVTGSYIARYNKVAGTLTLGTPTAVSTKVTDTELGTATFSLTASGNNIIVQIKGKDTYSIRWTSVVRRLYLKKT
jgi:hypothetical protein